MQALDSGSEHPMTIGLSTNNTKKNRFKNIAVCKLTLNGQKLSTHLLHTASFTDNDNRITLQRLEGHRDCQEPYVNACFVNVGG